MSDLVPLIRALLKASPNRMWTGTAADLRAALRLEVKEPRALGKQLHQILPHLAAAGIEMSFSRRGKQRTRLITIRPTADMSAPPSPLETLLLAAPPARGRLLSPGQLAACRERAARQQRAFHRENALLEARRRIKREGLTLRHIHHLIEALAAASPHDRATEARSLTSWLAQQGLSSLEIAAILFAATQEPPPMSHMDERLRALLAARNITSPVLESVPHAGRQLELLTPVVLARTPRGVIIEPRVVVPRGTILIVVADQTRAAVASLAPSDPARESLPAIARHVHALVPQTELRDAIAVILDTFLTDGPRASEGEAFNLVSALLATLPEKDLLSLGEGIDQAIDHDICPALIALRGPASDGDPNHASIAWPLLMPVARYLGDLGE